MNPGATTSPVASIASRPSCLEKVPTAATLPSLIPTSARRAAAPVPSTTRPPTTTRSNRGGVCGCAVIQAAKSTAAVPRLASMGRILSRGEGWSRRGRRGRRARNRLNSETQRHGEVGNGRRHSPADDGPAIGRAVRWTDTPRTQAQEHQSGGLGFAACQSIARRASAAASASQTLPRIA